MRLAEVIRLKNELFQINKLDYKEDTMADTQVLQAALKIQRAWRAYWICPYCDSYRCRGIYSEFDCGFMWDKSDLLKLDIYLDRGSGRW